MNFKRQVDLENGRVSINILQTAMPTLVAQLVHLLYSVVDRFYIGRIPGEGTSGLAGIGLCFPIIILITAFTNLYGMGGAPLSAMERGRGDKAKAQTIMNAAFTMLVITAVAITVLGEIFAVPVLKVFGADQVSLPYAAGYLRIYLLGTVFCMISGGMNYYINAQGFPAESMTAVAIGAIANIALDPLFIFVFGMGINGAALATIISQTISGLYTAQFLRGSRSELKLRFLNTHELKENRSIEKEIIGLGFAPFIMQFTSSLVNACCNRVLSGFGSEYISVMTIIASVRELIETPVTSIGQGASPVISYNYGAGRADKTRKAIFMMTGLMVSYSAMIWLTIRLWPNLYIGLFSSDTAIQTLAVPAMHLYFATFVFQSVHSCGQAVFKALGKKKPAIFFSIFRKIIVVLPLTYILAYGFHMGADGVFAAEPVSNLASGICCYTCMLLTVMPELKKLKDVRSITNENTMETRTVRSMRTAG